MRVIWPTATRAESNPWGTGRLRYECMCGYAGECVRECEGECECDGECG